MKLILAIILGIFIVPLAALLLGALASLGWCLVRDRIDGETRRLKRDLDGALQREWDLKQQLNAVGLAEARVGGRCAVSETWN